MPAPRARTGQRRTEKGVSPHAAAQRGRAGTRPAPTIKDGKLVIPGNPLAAWANANPPSVEPLLAYVTGGRMRRSVIDALLCCGKPLEITVEIDPGTEKVTAWRVRTKAFGGDAAPTVVRRSEG